MERFMLNMQKKESEKAIMKKWAKVNGNGSNGDCEANFYSSSIMYKTFKFPERPSFSIGDSWTEIIDGLVCFYKVQLIEDIIIPVGKYRCFKISEEAEGGIRNQYWFAPTVGLVKWQIGEIKGVLQECKV